MPIIQLQRLALSLPYKTCFSAFDCTIIHGQRIAILGDNGSGKSSLLRMIAGQQAPSEGRILLADGLTIGYLPQVLTGDEERSGGQRVNRALCQVLANKPSLLLLDEPTNHLDSVNRRALGRLLQHFPGSVLLVSHDEKWVDQLCDTIWHIDNGQVTVFNGRYRDYQAERTRRRRQIEQQIGQLRQARQATHQALMQEQTRASHARDRGQKSIEQNRWPTVKSAAKLGRGNRTAGKQRASILAEQSQLAEQLAGLRLAPVITPRFQLPAKPTGRTCLLQISNASVAYQGQTVLGGLHLQLQSAERMALVGPNGCGKTTLVRALLADPRVSRTGDWQVPDVAEIGYLDQHYANLQPDLSVLTMLASVVPDWSQADLRHHLSDFLFRQQTQVDCRVAALSGGERARLSLACIAARPPRLLILDEVTNNLDQPTRQHVLTILQAYPAAILLISHDEDVLQQVGVQQIYRMQDERSGLMQDGRSAWS